MSNRLTESIHSLVCALRTKRRWLEGQQDGILFRDGFVKVSSDGVEKLDFDPDHRQTAALPFSFVPNAVPEEFIKMLRGCWAGEDDVDQRIKLLREWLGAALCNRASVYSKGLILVGGGSNGKSTVQKIVRSLFPTNTVTAVAPQDMDNEYRRALLAEARLNVVAELPEADILSSEAVKAMISGDLMVGRVIRESPFEFEPRAAHLFSANNLPGVRDMSKGFWRRWLILDFNRNFADHEQDKHLGGRIVARELAEIASWAMEGAAELAGRGFYAVPSSSEEALRDWRRGADQIASFIDARTEPANGREEWSNATKLYNVYVQWASASGHRQMSQVNFGKRLLALGAKKTRTTQGTIWDLKVKAVKLQAVANGS